MNRSTRRPFSNVAQACRSAARAERENVALYDRLLTTVEEPGVRTTLYVLREASATRHLPAFERWTARQ